MKKFLFLIGLCLFAANCASNKPALKPEQHISAPYEEVERMIWASAETRPAWTVDEPRGDGPNMYFTGLSDKNATESLAREEAKRFAAKSVVSYLGTAVSDKFEQLRLSFGYSDEISNPTNVSKNATEILSAGVSKNLKTDKWYIEKWQTKEGKLFYKAYALASIPKAMLENAYNDVINSEKEKVQKKMKEEKNLDAKKQMQDALDAFDKMKKSGFMAE